VFWANTKQPSIGKLIDEATRDPGGGLKGVLQGL
jgi:hypothetical protein